MNALPENRCELFLLPGMDGTGKLFGPLLQVVAGSRVTKVLSYPSQQVQSYSQLVEFVRGQLPDARPYVLLAESFSGPIALRLAANARSNLRGLVLVASFRENPIPAFRFLAPLIFRVPRPPTWVLRSLLLGRDAPDSLLQLTATTIGSVAPRVLAARLRAVLCERLLDDSDRIEVPTLYLRASSDRLVGRAAMRSVAKICPQFRAVEIRGAHLLLQTQPRAAWEAVRSFLMSSDSLRN